MITSPNKPNPWQTALINAVTDPKELLEILALDSHWLEPAVAASKLFPLKVPREFITRMQKGDPYDPLLQQILPIGAEFAQIEHYTEDPLQEKNANPVPGLLHKYYGRVLLTITGACAINCRFCFRRHFPYAENNPGTAGWNQVFDYIAKDPSITEVLLSGGDPLAVSDGTLRHFIERLAAIPHVKRVRVHSRLPIVVPERITTELLEWMTATRLQTILVTHCNHPQEINGAVTAALRRLTGIPLLNQSVLLKGINDQAAVLIALSESLFAAGVHPYYLHFKDKTQGTAHFEVPLEQAKALHRQMQQKLPGYLVPKLVVEEPGEPAKTSIIT